jgi:ribosomal protein L15
LVKILWNGELKKALNFTWIEKFTKSAVEKIEKAGGKIS